MYIKLCCNEVRTVILLYFGLIKNFDNDQNNNVQLKIKFDHL